MEVRIKQDNEMVDATIEMVDGVMVVSPKEVKFEPKDGDIVFSGSSLISIFKEMSSDTSLSAYVALSNGELHEKFDFWSASNIRPATEEEKKKLFDKLKEEGYEFDFEKKELVKLGWKPKEGEFYYTPWISVSESASFFCNATDWDGGELDKVLYERGWCFKTKEECQELCDKLNEAINSVKI